MYSTNNSVSFSMIELQNDEINIALEKAHRERKKKRSRQYAISRKLSYRTHDHPTLWSERFKKMASSRVCRRYTTKLQSLVRQNVFNDESDMDPHTRKQLVRSKLRMSHWVD